MSQENPHPALVIESPNGTVIRIYQPVSTEYIKELLDEFMVHKGFVKPIGE